MACPFDRPKCQDEKNEKMKEKEERKKRKGGTVKYSPCFCEGVAFTQTRLRPTGLFTGRKAGVEGLGL